MKQYYAQRMSALTHSKGRLTRLFFITCFLSFCISYALQVTAQTTLVNWTYEPLQGTAAAPTPNAGIYSVTASSSVVGSMSGPGTATGSTTGCTQATGTNAWAIGTANPGTANESSGVQFLFSTVGYENIKFRFDQRFSNTATRTVRIQYTLNGTTWINLTADSNVNYVSACTDRGAVDAGRIDIGTPVGTNVSDGWSRREINFSGITAANNNPNFGVRIVAAHYSTTGAFRQANNVGTAATGGTWRFDNVLGTGTLIASATINTSGSLTAMSTTYGITSAASGTTVSVTGSGLTNNVIATAPAFFEVSRDGTTFQDTIHFFNAGGSASGTLYVRMKATATVAGSPYAGNIVISTTGASNVNVSIPASTVSPKGVTFSSATAQHKIYDATNSATITGAIVNGAENGDILTATGGGTFAQSSIGTAIIVTASLSVSGTNASSYSVTAQPTGLTADITAKDLSITGITADNKIFDGNTNATLSGTATLVGVETADISNVTLGGIPTATFASAAVGTGIPVTVTGYSISGSAAGNYTLSQPTGLTADITASPAPVITSALTATETYGVAITNYTITATNSPTSFNAIGLPGGLSVNTSTGEISGTPQVVGTYTVTISASNGGGAGNANLVITINPKGLTVTGATADTKEYDGNTAATITGSTLQGIVGADMVTISNTGTFDTKNVGTGKAVTSTQTLGGPDAFKYTLTQPAGLTANVTAKTLTIAGAVAQNKVFDGNTTATITGTLAGVVSPDVVTLNLSGTFASSAIGNGIPVSSTSTIGGADAGNYTLTQPTGLTANITEAPTTLAAGDIAIIGYNTSGSPDNFAILVLKNLTSDTKFFINDNELASSSSTSFTDLSEGEASFTVKSGQSIPAGTVIVLPWGATAVSTSTYDWSSTSSFGLGNNNEEIYIYTASSITSTTPDAFIYFAKIGSSTSAIPSSLSSGSTAITPSGTSLRYATSGATYTACKPTLLTAIGNTASNWNSTGATTMSASDWTFTVLPTCPIEVNLSVSTTSASESAATSITITATAASAVLSNQTLSVAVGGTGITAGDYTLSDNTITIPTGLTTGSVTMTIIDDSEIEGTETATVTISNPSSGLVLGSTNNQNITIAENDIASIVITPTGSGNAVTEGGITDTFTVVLSAAPNADVVLTGTPDAQVTVTPAVLTFTSVNWNVPQTVTVSAVDDNVVEGNHSGSVAYTVASADLSYHNISVPSVSVSVTDNDVAHTVAFVRADTTVNESASSVKIWLRVTNAGNAPGSVDLLISGAGNATNSADYSVMSTTLNIPANAVLNQIFGFDVTINDDATLESDEYIICKLNNANGLNITTTGIQQHTLYIKDNDKLAPVASNQLNLSFVSSFSNGTSGTNSLEISAYDSASKRVFVANSVGNKLDIINFSNPSAPVLISSINLGVAPFNGAINSVDVFNGIVALALEGLTDKQANGKVVFTDIHGTYLSEAATGAMPDMVTFNHAGTKVYTANEGEPNAAYTNDPVGSITVIDLSSGVATPSASTIGFTAYNGQEATLRAQGIRIYGVTQPGSVPSTAAQDFEPEYITISDDDSKAWVTLQENNALVELDLTNNTIIKLIPLGYKDHNDVNNPFDVSDQTFGINLANFNVKGMYEPDAIAQYTSGGTLYLLTANEGDARAYSGFNEETRVNALTLDPTVYPNAADIKNNAVLGRLTVTNKLGDTDNDGDIDQIHCLGGRSFSIWNPAAVNPLVFDSKDDLERITSTHTTYSQFFNMSNTMSNTAIKNRSDDKGPEPEGIAIGKIGGRDYAFVSLERIGGVMIYDITNPASPAYVTYANSRATTGGDRGAEGIIFVPSSKSPNGKNLVLLSNEISSTLSVFEINPCAAPGIASIANTGGTSICPGGFVKLYHTDNNTTYTRQWLKDGIAIAGATDSVYNATVSGSYRLVVFNATGCVDTSAIITLTATPAASVNLSVNTNTGSESESTAVTVTATTSAPVCGNQTVSLGVSGTGITTGDYTLSNSTITIPDGQTTGSVTFTVVSDNVVEPAETAVLTISNPSSGLVLGGTTTQNIAISDYVFTLQVLHASDFEAGVDAVADAPRFAAIVDTLEGTYANTIKLSSGDNYIPGPFMSSGEDPSLAAAYKAAYESYYNTTFNSSSVNLAPGIGRADISIMNFIGIEASALGNHEFDLGTNEVRNIIRGANNSAGTVRTWFGAQFPYLSANLNFSADGNLSAIATTNRLLPNTAFQSNPSESVSTITNKLKLAPSTIIMKGGQKIGIVGATTQVLASISSPGATTVVGGGADNMNILAGILQPVINDLIADGCNKVILLSHLQQLYLEKELAGKISGVDIIMAGGSHTLMADSNDRLRAGDVAVESYPFMTTGLDGKSIALINTDANYQYVGRLVVDFDADGNLIPSSINPTISGVYATDAQGLNDAWGANVGNAFAVGTRGYQVQLLCNAIGNVITAKDGNLFGKTSVFLEGRRNLVRTEETNLGNLSAEANLWMAKFYDPSTVISIKNGGGIRSAIGNVNAVGSNVTLEPPIANPSAGKQAGDISQLDIENSLRFNNQLSLVTLTASGLRSILEHAVAATTATSTPGQFAQVAGVRYSYNFSLPVGSRILNAVLTDAGGTTILDTLVLNGTTYGNLSRTFRVVTLNFLAGGGDSYPFNTLGTNRIDLNTVPAQGPALASFTNAGSEQDAFAEYMKSQHSITPYGITETPLVQDCRIQRIPARTDNVLPPNPGTNGTLALCNVSTVTESQLFAALGGTPASGGTWSPTPAGSGVYTYMVTSPSCSGSASATVTVMLGNTTYSTQTETAYVSYTWMANGTTYTQSGIYTHTLQNTSGCDSILSLNLTIIPAVNLSLKAFLGGAYDPQTGLMQDSLRSKQLIPLTEIYSIAPFNRPQVLLTGGETVSPSLLNITGPDAIVDWVYIEVRSGSNANQIVATKRALIQRDGDVVDTNGSTSIFLPGLATGQYFVSLKHRNHLGIMTANPITLNLAPALINFTQPSYPVWVNAMITANPPRKISGSAAIMIPGDANFNKNVRYNGLSNDKLAVLNVVGAATPNNIVNGYRTEDVNMDGQVKYNSLNNDRSLIGAQIGVANPNLILSQHTPN